MKNLELRNYSANKCDLFGAIMRYAGFPKDWTEVELR